MVTESYVELKLDNGDLDFIMLYHERTPYEGPDSFIKAPEPVLWEGANR